MAVTLRVPSQFPTIQQAINASQTGDIVLVAPGTYVENINFIGKAITVTSEAGASATTIDGNDLNTVVTFTSGEGENSILSGFTIRNGNSNVFLGGFGSGGGIYIMGASPVIRQNVITQNSATYNGGGISSTSLFGDGYIIRNSSPQILNNTISLNRACAGAGISIFNGAPIIKGNLITENYKAFCSGGVGGAGIMIGGCCEPTNVQVLDNIISNNQAEDAAGIYINVNGDGFQIVRGNLISGNLAYHYAGLGGGMVIRSAAVVSHNLLVNNRAVRGGGIYAVTVLLTVINNTIVNNDGYEGSGIVDEGIQNTYVNNIIVAKPGQPAVSGGYNPLAPTIFKFNNVFNSQGAPFGGFFPDLTGVNSNISVDPLFINPGAGNYHLRPGSPSIDAGDNTALNLPTVDLDGNPRIVDGDGNGSAIIDMGVYEFGSAPFDLCIQDESSGDILRINSSTGAYQLIRCRNGFTLSGTARLTRRGCILTAQDNQSDRRIMAQIDTCANRATASIQIFSQGGTFTLTDRNTTNNTCQCPSNN